MINSPDKELVDYYDTNGIVVGFGSRNRADDENLIYPNVLVLIFSNEGKVWIQKRSSQKKHYPGIWDVTACGALEHGEESVVAAGRELKEEMNLECELIFVEKFLNTFPSEDGRETRTRMSHLFIGISDDTPQANEEVDAVDAFEPHELLLRAQDNPADFIPSFALELDKAIAAYEKLPKS